MSLISLGAHIRTGSTAVQQTFNLKQLFSHESFSMQHLRNDIALLQLDRPATLSSKVNTVCLPTKGSKVAPGTRCFITGNVFFPHPYLSSLSPQVTLTMQKSHYWGSILPYFTKCSHFPSAAKIDRFIGIDCRLLFVTHVYVVAQFCRWFKYYFLLF